MTFQLLIRYGAVGIFNTLLHWGVFLALFHEGYDQKTSNVVAFCVAVTFSFFVNARWTFKASPTTVRYGLYVVFMGTLALAFGWSADRVHLPPLVTLAAFSAMSLILGFLYSRLVVFRQET